MTYVPTEIYYRMKYSELLGYSFLKKKSLIFI